MRRDISATAFGPHVNADIAIVVGVVVVVGSADATGAVLGIGVSISAMQLKYMA